MKKTAWIIKNLEEIISTTALSLTLLISIYNVFSRYLFNKPEPWADELSSICLVWAVFTGAAACYKKNLHYGMDFLVDHLPMGSKLLIRKAITFACIFLFGFLTYISYDFTISTSKITAFYQISYRYINIATVVGFGSMTVYSVIFFIEGIVCPRKYTERYVHNYEDEDVGSTPVAE